MSRRSAKRLADALEVFGGESHSLDFGETADRLASAVEVFSEKEWHSGFGMMWTAVVSASEDGGLESHDSFVRMWLAVCIESKNDPSFRAKIKKYLSLRCLEKVEKLEEMDFQHEEDEERIGDAITALNAGFGYNR